MAEIYTGFGVDVAQSRADDLDKKMIKALVAYEAPTVLDVGCGAGGQSLRLVNAGARVHGVDIFDFSIIFSQLCTEHDVPESTLSFTCGPIEAILSDFTDNQFQLCSMQRMLHYLPYKKAREVLTDLRRVVEGPLFLSVTGIDSDIGTYYKDIDKPIEKRFCRLTDDSADIFMIQKPMCLYTETELCTLLLESGWGIQECWISAFGNIKVICE